MNYIGDFAEDSTVRIALTTNDGSGGAVAPSSAFEVADFRVYKNGSATQKTSDNGMTITSPFDSVTGLHTLEIDTSNDTGDSGFWTTGADYWVVAVPDETVDSQTVVQVVASFSIENRYMRGTDGANTTTPPTTGAIADAVYDEAYAGHTTPGTYGFLWDQWRKSNTAITGEVTSAVTPTTTQFSTDITGYADTAFDNAVLVFINGSTNADFRGIVSGYVQSNGVVTITPALPQAPVAGDEFTIAIPSFVYTLAQVQSGLATTANITEIKGATWSSATDTLEEIRDAVDAGGGGGVTVAPLQATAPNRVAGTEIVTYINDTSDIGPIVVTDGDGDAVDLSSYTLKVCIERKESNTIDANITPTVSGAGSNQVTFTPTSACVDSTTPRKWSLRSTSNGQVFAFGDFKVEWPARLS